jgi:cell division protein FtsI/penicillin-binding protein 2
LEIFKNSVRHFFLAAITSLLFGIAIWRVLDLSYINREKYYKTLEKVRLSITTIPARRGAILDRNFETLALDETKIILGVDPFVADPDGDLKKIYDLAEFLEMDVEDVLKNFAKRRAIVDGAVKKIRWVPICEIDSESLYSAVKSMGIRGVYGVKNRGRTYPFGRAMAHVVGFVNRENVPVCGVERYMDFYLRGQDGYIESEKDGSARELVQYRKKELPIKNGNDVVLTIDKNIQWIAYDEAENLVKNFSPRLVSIIVSEATTGDILALVNYPNYDPNSYWEFPVESMQNLAVCNVYEPASVFKIVVTSFALEYGLANEGTVFDCTQATLVHRGKKITIPRDHTPFDKLTLVDAVRKSSNRAVAQLAVQIGEQGFYKCVKEYGFGEKAGYGFDGESAGILFPVSKWDGLTVTRMAMGHAIGVVPMQVHGAMSVIANGGILLKPNLFKCVMDGNVEILSMKPVIKRRVISPQTAVRMRKILHNPQSGKLANGIEFAGKTGTGQKIIDGQYSHTRHTSSYSGFFPADAPRIVITVVVDDAKVGSGIAWGSVVSLPVFKNMAERIAQHLDL